MSTLTDRDRAKLNQVVCTLEGMAGLLVATPGDYAVVIHGDWDCVNVLVPGMDRPGAERFFSTGLTADEATRGDTLPRLAECLEAVARLEQPSVIFVLGTCLTALIGDDVKAVVADVEQQTGVPVVALSGAGMRFVSQSRVLDRFSCLMLASASAPGKAPGEAPGEAPAQTPDASAARVNLVGFDPGPAVRDQLAALGIEVNAVLDRGAPFEAWRSAGAAAWNVVLDRALFEGFLDAAAERFSQQALEVAYPIGCAGTERFFDELIAGLGLDVAPGPDHQAAAAAARDAMTAAAEELNGQRLGFNIGSMKNLEPRTLAREGLVDLAYFIELGCDPVLLVQGDDRPARMEAVRATLLGLGCDFPLAVFADTVFFGELCREQGCSLVYGSDHLREQAEAADVALVPQGALRPGYDGVVGNLALIEAARQGVRR